MSWVHDAFDDLLDSPWIHAGSLLERERVVSGLELHEWARRPGANLHYCFQ